MTEVMPTPPSIQRGSKIGRFIVEDQLGAGGMGLVFSAHDRQLDRRVALKVLRTLTTDDESQRLRLLREGQAMARITHENVITVHEVGIEGKLVFLAQELLDGGTLGQWLRTQRTQDEILAKFIAAGRGLAAAHAAGLVHRDFKPDNVLLGKDGRVRVADFGLARAIEALEAETVTGRVEPLGRTHTDLAQSPMAPLTRTGAVMGTPLYMAPEQHEGKGADERSDQFSFCVALYQALYGLPPFAGKTAVALADNVLAGRIEPPTKGSSVPGRLRKILLRGLSVPPADRYPSMEALLSALSQPPSNKLARVALIVGGLIVVGGGAIGGAYVVSSRSDKAPVVAPVRRDAAVNAGSALDVAAVIARADQLVIEGDGLFAKGELDRAATVFEEARAQFETAGMRPQMYGAMQRLAEVGVERGKLAEAAQLYVTTGELRQKDGLGPEAAISYALAAMVRIQQGQLADADALVAKAKPLTRPNAFAEKAVALAAGQLALARGDLVGASELVHDCPDLGCVQLRAEVFAEQGDVKAARSAYDDAVELAAANEPRLQALALALAQLDLDEAVRDEGKAGAEGKNSSAADRAGGAFAYAKARGAAGMHAHAMLMRARVKLAEGSSNEALDILQKIDASTIASFRVRTQYLITLGKVRVLVEGAEEGGFDVIAQALADAEKAGATGLVFEARLARVEATAFRNAEAAKLDAKALIHESTQAGFARYAELAKAISRE